MLGRLAFRRLAVACAALLALTVHAEDVEWPLKLDNDDVAYFAATYDIDGLHNALEKVFALSHRVRGDRGRQLLPSQVASGSGSHYTAAYKLEMDLEQAYHIGETSHDAEVRQYFLGTVAPLYESVLARIPDLSALREKTGGLYAFKPVDFEAGIADVYNRAIHVPPFDEIEGGCLSSSFDAAAVEKQWRESEPHIAVIDNILSDVALGRIRELLQVETVWYQTKMPEKFGGYAGAYIDDGLHQRLLIALAFELHRALPEIMTGHDLQYLWAYKYDSDFTGINIHADQAAVNVNLWITPEDANLNKDTGGLVIFTTKPPAGMDFAQYNADTERVVQEILKPTAVPGGGYANRTVPYRENRAVLFDSALFHHTDEFSFAGGYTRRRINLTILYGEMQVGAGTGVQSDL